jgi:hypothetical protein
MKILTAADNEAMEFVATALAYHFTRDRTNWRDYQEQARAHIVAYAACRAIERGALQPKPKHWWGFW